MFRKVTAVVLLVQDLDKCLAFYRDIVGLEVAQVEPRFAAFKMDDQDFALEQVSEGAEMLNTEISELPTKGVQRVLLCTRVPDVDAAYKTLKAKGVEFTKPPNDQSWGLRTAYFKDPENNIWEIAQPL